MAGYRMMGSSNPGRMMKMAGLVFGLCALALINTDLLGTSRRALSETRKLCKVVFNYPDWKQYWEDLFPAKVYPYQPVRDLVTFNSKNIGYFLTIPSCPKDSYPAGDPHDPGHAFYDAAALLKYSIHRNTYPAGSKYNATMYAVIHPEAVTCLGPNHEPYDRVKVLQDIGYKVIIVGSPVYKAVLKGYVKENIDADKGVRDFMRLQSLTYDHHPAVVMVDFTTLMLKPIDNVYDQFIADPSKKIVMSFDYPTNLPATGKNAAINEHFLIAKPSEAFFKALTDAFIATSYSPTWGWNWQGIKDFSGVLGAKGFLVHYFSRVEKGVNSVLSRCKYANDASNPMGIDPAGNVVCRDPMDCQDCRTLNLQTQVSVIKMIHTCGKPWECAYNDNWDSATKTACEGFHREWFKARIEFEQSCWHNGPPSFRAGQFKPAVFMGFCNCKGLTCYDRMIDDKSAAAVCDKDTQTSSVVARMNFPNGAYQNHKMYLTTGLVSGSFTACAEGKIVLEGFEPPYNIGIVIDISGSTGAVFKGKATGDVNKDGKNNTILDAEISAVIAVLQNIADSPGLGNNNVNIGLTVFSTEATYVGMYDPCDPTNPSKINAPLLNKLTGLRSGGFTHFDDALDKIIEYYKVAPPNRNNILMFLSDGVPNVVGDGDKEEPTNKYTNNQPGALDYRSELAILDSFNVKRIAVGVGSGSDVRVGYGLDMIDNTPDPYTQKRPTLAVDSDALVGALMNSPLAGEMVEFTISVNGAPMSYDATSVLSGPTGFEFGTFVVTGLDPHYGAVNDIKVETIIDYDGMDVTTDDQAHLVLSNFLPGTLL